MNTVKSRSLSAFVGLSLPFLLNDPVEAQSQNPASQILKKMAEVDCLGAWIKISGAKDDPDTTAEEQEVLKRMEGMLKSLGALGRSDTEKISKEYEVALSATQRWRQTHQQPDFDAAFAGMRSVLIQDSTHVLAMGELAALLHDVGAFELSRDLYAKALANAGASGMQIQNEKQWRSRMLNGLAWTCVIHGDFSSGKKFAGLALAGDPQLNAARHTLAAACMGLGQRDEAIRHLNEVIRICEGDGKQRDTLPIALGDRGIARLQTGSIPDGVADLQQALRIAPDHVNAERWNEAIGLASRPSSSIKAETKTAGPYGSWGFLSEQAVTTNQLATWDFASLRYGINFLYAKHGYVFPTREIQEAFASLPWYRPSPGTSMEDIDARMCQVEAANVKVLADMRARAKAGGPDAELAMLSQRVITAKELATWDFGRLRYAINFLYAKHGYVFPTPEIQTVFKGKSWYRPSHGASMDDIDAKMSQVEAANIKVLAEVKALKSRPQ